jgi:hypothetical protein
MLIKYVSVLVSLLLLCPGLALAMEVNETQVDEAEALMKKAPCAAEISPVPSHMPSYNSANSYLWKPMLFHRDLLEALQALSIVENLNFPPYLKVLRFIFNDSILSHDFRDYITLNYCKPSDLSPQHQPLFWRSLILSSFTDFSSILPQHSRQIMEQLQLISSLDENQDQFLFGYGLLDDQFDSAYHFPLVAGWGHTTTVKLLLQHRTDVSAIYAGWGLKTASEDGHISIVKLLLQSHIDISVDYIGNALQYAAKSNRKLVVEHLIQHRIDISTRYVGLALREAAQGGHSSLVEFLLQYRADISADDIGWALYCACGSENTFTVQLLLENRTDIPVFYIGWVLECAAKWGCTRTAESLLHSHFDIPTDQVYRALEIASQSGHTAIVDLICQHQFNMNS